MLICILISFFISLPLSSTNAECICYPDNVANPTKYSTSLSNTVETVINTMLQTWNNLHKTLSHLLNRLKDNDRESSKVLHHFLNDEYRTIFRDLFPNLNRVKQSLQQFDMICNDDRPQSRLNPRNPILSPFRAPEPNLNVAPIRWPKYYISLLPRRKYNYYINYDLNKANTPTQLPPNFNFPLRRTITRQPLIKTANQLPGNTKITTTPSTIKHSDCLQKINNTVQNFIDRINDKRSQFNAVVANLKQFIHGLLKTPDKKCKPQTVETSRQADKTAALLKLFPKYDKKDESCLNKIAKFIQTGNITLHNKDELIKLLIKLVNNSNDSGLIGAGMYGLKLLYNDLFKFNIEQCFTKIPTSQDVVENNALIILNQFVYTEDFYRLIPKLFDKKLEICGKSPTQYLLLILTETDKNPNVINAASYLLTKQLLNFVPRWNTKEELDHYLLVFPEIRNLVKDKNVINGTLGLQSDGEILKKLLNHIAETNDSKANEAANFLLSIQDLQEILKNVEKKHPDIKTDDYSKVKSLLQTKKVHDYLKKFKLTDYTDNDKRFKSIITLMLDENSPVKYTDALSRLQNYFNSLLNGEGVLVTKQLKLNLTKHFDKVFFKRLNQMTSSQIKDYAIVLRFITLHKNRIELGDFDFNQNDSSDATIRKFFRHLLDLKDAIVPVDIKRAVLDLIQLVY